MRSPRQRAAPVCPPACAHRASLSPPPLPDLLPAPRAPARALRSPSASERSRACRCSGTHWCAAVCSRSASHLVGTSSGRCHPPTCAAAGEEAPAPCAWRLECAGGAARVGAQTRVAATVPLNRWTEAARALAAARPQARLLCRSGGGAIRRACCTSRTPRRALQRSARNWHRTRAAVKRQNPWRHERVAVAARGNRGRRRRL
jgi:hypothetical protein